MKTPWTILIGTLMLCTALQATPQDGDRLVYRGETYCVYPSPLEQWLRHHDLPDAMKTRSFSSACLNGYVCTWEICNDELFLKTIAVPSWPGWKDIPLTAVFPGHESRVQATWFTGTLISPKICLQYVHGGMGGNYLYKKIFGFRDGLLIGTDFRFGLWLIHWIFLAVVEAILVIPFILWLLRFRRIRTLKQSSPCNFQKELDAIHESCKASCLRIDKERIPETRRIIFVVLESLFLLAPLAIIADTFDLLPFRLENIILNVLIRLSMTALIGVIVWVIKFIHTDRTYAKFALITVIGGVLLIFRFLNNLIYWT